MLQNTSTGSETAAVPSTRDSLLVLKIRLNKEQYMKLAVVIVIAFTAVLIAVANVAMSVGHSIDAVIRMK